MVLKHTYNLDTLHIYYNERVIKKITIWDPFHKIMINTDVQNYFIYPNPNNDNEHVFNNSSLLNNGASINKLMFDNISKGINIEYGNKPTISIDHDSSELIDKPIKIVNKFKRNAVVYINSLTDGTGFGRGASQNLKNQIGLPNLDNDDSQALSRFIKYLIFGFWNPEKIIATGADGVVSALLENHHYFKNDEGKFILENIKKIYKNNKITPMLGIFGDQDIIKKYPKPKPVVDELITFLKTPFIQCNYNETTDKISNICQTKFKSDYHPYEFFDGIDVDIENITMGKENVNWVIEFTRELHTQLTKLYSDMSLNKPEGKFLISHAPQAPYFRFISDNKYNYVYIDQQVGKIIDWYNIQYYNQIPSQAYITEKTLFNDSGRDQPKTSVSQLINQGIPSDKIVIGKIIRKVDGGQNEKNAPSQNDSIVDPDKLHKWINTFYKTIPPNTKLGGIMVWQLQNIYNYEEDLRTVTDATIQQKEVSAWINKVFSNLI